MKRLQNKCLNTRLFTPTGYINERSKVVCALPDLMVADFMIKLKGERLTKAAFFGCIMEAYLENDPNLLHFLEKKLIAKGMNQTYIERHERTKLEEEKFAKKNALDIGDVEKQNIFDILEQEWDEKL